jgi:uridylate kinase
MPPATLSTAALDAMLLAALASDSARENVTRQQSNKDMQQQKVVVIQAGPFSVSKTARSSTSTTR